MSSTDKNSKRRSRWWPKWLEPDDEKNLPIGFYMAVDMVVGVIGTATFAIYVWSVGEPAVIWMSFTVGIAAFMAGGLLGYLFGIPIAQREHAGQFASNTSLEQISDWLTKILIGVGLVEIRQLASWLGSVGDQVSRAIGLPTTQSLVVALILLDGVAGFVFFYLWSRVHMPRLFLKGEVKAAQVENQRLEEDLKNRELQIKIDRLTASQDSVPSPKSA